MSDALSFAVVTGVLQSIVQRAIGDAVPGVVVRVGPPRAPAPGAGPEVSLYLYLISPNEALRNNDLPVRSLTGKLVNRPALAVDLHYVITFFGEQDFATERMAASLASYIHASPAISPDLIRSTISPSGPYGYLSKANLADARELVLLHPYYPTAEELSKLWTVFFQMAHRVSLQYTAGPIIVDAGPPPDPNPNPRHTNFNVSHKPAGEETP